MTLLDAMDDLEARSPDAPPVMVVLDQTGDTKTTWNADDQNEVAAARTQFEALRAKGYTAYRVGKGGEKAEVMSKFDPEARAMILAPRMVGG